MSENGSDEGQLVLLQRRLAIGVLILLSILFLYMIASYFADVLRILGISILFSYLLINLVDLLTKYLRFRILAILLVYVFAAIVTIFGAILVVPEIAFQISQLVQSSFNQIPDLIQFLTRLVSPLEQRLAAAHIHVQTSDILSGFATNIPHPDPSMIFNKVSDVAMSTVTWLIYLVSILVVSFYFLLEGRKLKDGIVYLFPLRYHIALQQIAVEMGKSLQSFFRGQIVLGVLTGIVMLIIYLLFGIQYALLLSVILGAWEIVPVIGPPIGFIPTIISVAINGMHCPGNRLFQLLIITLVFQIVQQLKDNVFAPRYIGNAIGIHPVIIFIAIMIGARLDGILGIIFALPVACVINVFIQHLPLKTIPYCRLPDETI